MVVRRRMGRYRQERGRERVVRPCRLAGREAGREERVDTPAEIEQVGTPAEIGRVDTPVEIGRGDTPVEIGRGVRRARTREIPDEVSPNGEACFRMA